MKVWDTNSGSQLYGSWSFLAGVALLFWEREEKGPRSDKKRQAW